MQQPIAKKRIAEKRIVIALLVFAATPALPA